MKTRNVAIVHFNTPELTEAAILSLRKHGGEDYKVYILDNSDKRPFKVKKRGKASAGLGDVKVFDNTKGQLLNFDNEMERFPDKDATLCGENNCWGSDRHAMSVQLLWDLIPDGFLLMDSDVLIKQSVDFMFMQDECVCGHIIGANGYVKERLAPMLLWINVPLCRAGGARFFDPERTWCMYKGIANRQNCWDTGAVLLHDVRTLKPQCHGKRIDIRPLIEHYGNGSWKNNNVSDHKVWLSEHRNLWYTDPSLKAAKKYTVLTYIFNGYEMVHEIREKDPDAEYILVTDDPNLKSKTWDVVYDGGLATLSPFDKTFTVRYHPFDYAHTDTVVRIDGSIGINKPLRPLVDAFHAGGYDRCLMIHPRRDTIPGEYAAWVKLRHYPKEQADKCLAFFARMGYDLETRGIFQACFEIVKKNRVNAELNNITFSLLRYLGDEGKIDRLDQTVLTFVVNHLFEDRLSVMPVPESIITNRELMTWYAHNSNRTIGECEKCVQPMLFGKPVEY